MKPMPLDARIALAARMLARRTVDLERDPDNLQLQREVAGYKEIHERLMRLREKEEESHR